MENKININKATKNELLKLKYITPSIAERIISYRNEFGDIESLNEFVKVAKELPDNSLGYFSDTISTEGTTLVKPKKYYTFYVDIGKIDPEILKDCSLIITYRDTKYKEVIDDYLIEKQKIIAIEIPKLLISIGKIAINIKIIKEKKILYENNFAIIEILANNKIISITNIEEEEIEEIEYKFWAEIVVAEEEPNPFAGYCLAVMYTVQDDFELGGKDSGHEEEFIIDSQGEAFVVFKTEGKISEKLLLKVKAPSGEIISEKYASLEEIENNNNRVAINISPQEAITIEQVVLPERPQKISGRIVDLSGIKEFNKTQVTIFVSKVADAEIDPEKELNDNFFAIASFKTEETKGYFIFDAPRDYYTKAYAIVGIEKEESKLHLLPIELIEDNVIIIENKQQRQETKLFFPSRIILVVNSAELNNEETEKDDSTECNGLGLHRARAVLEEYSYFTAVRTSEPKIKGFTLEEEGPISLKEINGIVPVIDKISESELANDGIDREHLDNLLIRKDILLKYMNDRNGITPTNFLKAYRESNAKNLKEIVKPLRQVRAVGRHDLNIENAIDWDETPTIYQSTTLSHGHLLHFKQEWVSDGYSIGDLIYSLPLAPGQKKQVAVFDWERREATARSEDIDYQESLNNSLSRDRDVNEIVNSVVNESVRGGSYAETSSSSFGSGFFESLLSSSSGGKSSSSSTAWQNSSRGISANSLQKLHDSTYQAASAVRSQRNTVVQTVSQGESFTVETESVANYNHCHAMTIQYFEVLRHLKIHNRLAAVQECLFVPLIMNRFDNQKILRWREVLARYVRNRNLRRGFDSIERIENNYEGSDLPEQRFADEEIEYIEGDLFINFQFSDPGASWALNENDDDYNWISAYASLGFISNFGYHIERMKREAERDRRSELFYSLMAPEIASQFVNSLKINAVVESSNGGGETTVELPLDPTLISRFYNNRSLYISLRMGGEFINPLLRSKIKSIEISKASDIPVQFKDENGVIQEMKLSDAIPINSKITLQKGSIRYRTKHQSNYLFRNNRILDDLIGYSTDSDNEKARIAAPLNSRELRNPKNDDLELANNLRDHLNDNLEYYHKLIWLNISAERRFMFLDGIQATDFSEKEKYPNGVVRSVASVVENKLVGIIGNNLVFPVAPGFRLDPYLRGANIDLFALYKPLTPTPPINISLPTKGVFAEAVMGKCNSCEEIQENRFWRWGEEPIPDSPTQIDPISTGSRRSDTPNMEAKDLANALIQLQNAAEAPDPSGIDKALETISAINFEDITGLDQNQKNAIQGLVESYGTTKSLAQMGVDAFKTIAGLATQIYTGIPSSSGILNQVKDAIKQGIMVKEDGSEIYKEKFRKDLDNMYEDKSKSLSNDINKIGQVEDAVANGKMSSEIGDRMKNKIADKAVNSRLIESPEVKKIIDSHAGKGPINIKADVPGESLSLITGTGEKEVSVPSIIIERTDIEFEQKCVDSYRNAERSGFKYMCEDNMQYYYNISNGEGSKEKVKGFRGKIKVKKSDGTEKEFDCIERANGFTRLSSGTYKAVLTPRNSYPDNHEIYIYGNIFIHVANYPCQLDGCIAPGKEQWEGLGVKNSQKALNEIIEALGGWEKGKKIDLTIT